MTGEVFRTFLSEQASAAQASEAICIVNANGVVRFATPAAAHSYGYEVSDLVGHCLLRFVDPDQVDTAYEQWEAFCCASDQLYGLFNLPVISADGRRQMVQASVWRIPDERNFLILHHLSERFRERLEALYSILATVAGTLNLDEILDAVLREARRVIPCDCGTVFLLRNMRLHMARGDGHSIIRYSPELFEQLNHVPTTRLLRETGGPVLINDCEHDPRWTWLSGAEAIRSWLGTPLIHHGEFLGTINLDSTQPHTFSTADAELMRALASPLAAAVFTARQYEAEQSHAKHLQVLNDLTQAISRLNLDDVLEVVYQKINSLMDASTFYIGLYDAEAGIVRIVGAYDFGNRHEDQVQLADTGLVGRVLRSRQSVIIHDTQREPQAEAIIDGEEPRSFLMMPLITQDETVGVISVQSYQPNAYTSDDIALLEIIAGAVATAIRNAQLYDQTAERLGALNALHRIGLHLTFVQDADVAARVVVEGLLKLLRPQYAALYLSGRVFGQSRLWGGSFDGDGELLLTTEHPANDPHVFTLLDQLQEPVVLPDLGAQPDILEQVQPYVLTRALAVYPLRHGGELLGAMAVLWPEPCIFRSDDLRILELFSMQAALALENTRYHLALRRRLEEVTALQDLARRVSSSETLDDILHTVVRTLRDVYRCKSSSIGLYNPDTQEVEIRAAVGIPDEYVEQGRFRLDEYGAGHAVATGQVVYVPDTLVAPGLRTIDPGIRSMMIVPLTVHGHVIGTLNIDSTQPHAFTPDHERVLTIAGGQIAAAIETVHLLDEARARAADLAEANRNLEALHELRNELVQNLSHELRNPLSLIQGYAVLMRDSELGPIVPQQVDALNVINDKSEAILRMINDILSLEQIRHETLELDVIEMAAFCQQTANDMRLLLKDRPLSFETELASGTQLVIGDRDRLRQVLDNLIGNAAKFSPENGVIRLLTRVDPAQNAIEISVIDQGIGIPADRLPHVFERFYQGDRTIKHTYGGTGLGLAIVRRIVEAHEGRIWVESTEGSGSTFTFTLPLAERQTEGVV
ncbi:MAG: GAF domain-containing protein [Chloroflexi bacterium]|nr:GAF domain-containing protein [Chloroflexota bacterium]